MVVRLFRARWAAVSLPLPVTLRQTIRFAPITRNQSQPLGETLMVPSLAAVPTKKVFVP
jgi:hypothetical protein